MDLAKGILVVRWCDFKPEEENTISNWLLFKEALVDVGTVNFLAYMCV